MKTFILSCLVAFLWGVAIDLAAHGLYLIALAVFAISCLFVPPPVTKPRGEWKGPSAILHDYKDRDSMGRR